ncbi:MAG: GTP-binding protein [Dysosmobacter sp.]
MRKLVVGILAHVDAGKTTLSEALLYQSGALRRLGRVDHQDAFLDTDAMERERGITIFSKQAVFSLKDTEVTLLDTPGHVDFSAEAERTLQVLDCAILVISGTDGVQAHTRTLWRLLERYHVPTFLFVNKMDLAGADRAAVLAGLKQHLGSGCVDFSGERDESFREEAAVCDESVLERYLETGVLTDGDLRRMVGKRKLFPCWFGSALKLEGVSEFLEGVEQYAPVPAYPETFGARIYKIARDGQGTRLTYLKVTGGTLRVKSLLTNRRPGLGEDQVWEEKADQIRIYSGAKFRTVEEAPAGTVCAVTGLSRSRAGEGLGLETGWTAPALEPVLTYQVLLPEGTDPHTALGNLRQLEEEDPQLHIAWNEQTRQIHVQLMGEIQLEILQRMIRERFGLEVAFGPGAICYRETIAAPVEGIGHFEPLRHYAEVHLLLEPGERGSGLEFGTACPEDQLEGRWQRLVLTHLAEKEHLGVLTGSPITDMKITLAAGRAHVKHTEGGDFRQATYRAVRQGLMEAESILLEPWYDFRLELPAHAGGPGHDGPPADGRRSCSAGDRGRGGCAHRSVRRWSGLGDYAREVAAYTQGQGRLSLRPGRVIAPARSQEAVHRRPSSYDPTAGCGQHRRIPCSAARRAGVDRRRWDQVAQHAPRGQRLACPQGEEPDEERLRQPGAPVSTYAGTRSPG